VKTCLMIVALGLCLAEHASAQQPLVNQSLDSARVVRLHLARGGSVHAVLLSPFAPESGAVTYRPRSGDCGVPSTVCRIRTPVSELRAIDVSHGYHTGRGALIGGVIGAMLGFVLRDASSEVQYYAAPCPPPGCGPRSQRTPSVLLTTAAGAALGAGVGALLGLSSPSWEPAP
jgi:hypothetical protein